MNSFTPMKSIRFWTWVRGAVRISLKPGQSLTHYHFARTEEGWTSETNTWSWDGHTLLHDWSTEGQDCDGRLRQDGCSQMYELNAVPDCCGETFHGQLIHYPTWQEYQPTSIYDQYAQASNY